MALSVQRLVPIARLGPPRRAETEGCRDAVGDPERVGRDGQARVDPVRRRHEGPVRNVEIVDLVGPASRVQHAGRRIVAEPQGSAAVRQVELGLVVEEERPSRPEPPFAPRTGKPSAAPAAPASPCTRTGSAPGPPGRGSRGSAAAACPRAGPRRYARGREAMPPRAPGSGAAVAAAAPARRARRRTAGAAGGGWCRSRHAAPWHARGRNAPRRAGRNPAATPPRTAASSRSGPRGQ